MDDFVAFALGIEFSEALFVFILIFSLSIFLLRKSFYNMADPFVFFIVFNSFAITTTFFTSIHTNNFKSILDLVFFNLCFFSLSIIYPAKPNKLKLSRALYSFGGAKTDVFMGVLAGTTIFSTLILWVFVGVPILADDITNAKVTMYQNGFGFLRYLQMIAPPILSLFGMLELTRRKLNNNKKILMMIYIIASAFISISSGSKSSLIYLVFNIGLIIYIGDAKYDIILYKKFLKIVFVSSIIVLLVILSSTNEGAIQGAALRFLASGDIYFFWYGFDLSSTLSSFKPLEFIIYLVSPLLGMLGVVGYEYPIGAIVMHEATNYPLSSFGPNAQLPVLLSMFFASYSYIVSGLFGIIFYLLRTQSYKLINKLGVFGFCFFIIFHFSALSVFVDLNYLVSLTVSSLLLIPIFLFLSIILLYSSASLKSKDIYITTSSLDSH